MSHFFVGSHQEVASIRQGRKARWAAWQHDKAMPLELQIADNFRTKEAIDVAGGGDFKAGPDFLSNDAAADEFTALEDEDFPPCASEVSGSHEAIMSCA